MHVNKHDLCTFTRTFQRNTTMFRSFFFKLRKISCNPHEQKLINVWIQSTFDASKIHNNYVKTLKMTFAFYKISYYYVRHNTSIS